MIIPCIIALLVLSILFMICLVYTWRLNVKQCKLCDEIEARGKKVKSNKEDLQSLLDDNFHKTLLALPVLGVIAFTIIPIIYMIIVAFTNYDGAHDGYSNLFTWSETTMSSKNLSFLMSYLLMIPLS